MSLAKILCASPQEESELRITLENFQVFSVDAVSTGQECCRAASEVSYAAAVLDVPLAGYTPDELLSELRRIDCSLPVLIRHRHGSAADAVRLIKAGANHFFSGGLDPRELRGHLEMACETRRAISGSSDLPSWRKSAIGSSSEMERIFSVIELVGPRRCTVLITGETGTGKEVIARAIHAASNRSRLPMITVNCAALPENLLEAELFGHVKGAFTGATNHRLGRFEQASGGTIFLDEIAEMPLDLQAKLLRVLQEREFQRVGSSETVRVDARVIAGTNADLTRRVEEGRFREDLFYRLSVVPVRTPPLRDRVEDIPALVLHLVEKICRLESIAVRQVSPEALWRLSQYTWPGNVRQLENSLEAAIALSGARTFLTPEDFPLPQAKKHVAAAAAQSVSVPDHGLDFEQTVSQFERSILMQALQKTAGNKKQAADMLGLKRTTLAAKLRILEAA